MHELELQQSAQLMQEIKHISLWIQKEYQPHKINVASLGNMVSQLHVHIVGRFQEDPFWPHSIWQPDYAPKPYTEEALAGRMLLLEAMKHFPNHH